MNREAWLHQAAIELTPWFTEGGLTLPKFRLSCGFPSALGMSRRKRRIGECWNITSSSDGHHEIFISPVIAERVEVLGVVAHELAHAADNNEHGHKAPFTRIVRLLSLEGKPTATIAGDAFKARAAGILKNLGEYPHAPLTATSREKVQTTRMLKAACPQCDYTIRLSQKWADHGLPKCPLCTIRHLELEGE